MKITLGGYEIDIKAKAFGENKYSTENLLYFLNELSIVYFEAARFNEGNGYNGTAKDYDRKSLVLYNAVKKSGGYVK